MIVILDDTVLVGFKETEWSVRLSKLRLFQSEHKEAYGEKVKDSGK